MFYLETTTKLEELESEFEFEFRFKNLNSNWPANYVGRKDHPIEEAENVIYDENYHVTQIGKIMDFDKSSVPGEFIGMVKLTDKGAEVFKQTYHASCKKYKEGPFQRAASIKKAYLTDINIFMSLHIINHCMIE